MAGITVIEKVTTYIYKAHEFAVCKARITDMPEILKDRYNETGFVTIDEKYIDDDGRLNITLSMADMGYENTMDAALETRKMRVDCENMSLEEIAAYYAAKFTA